MTPAENHFTGEGRFGCDGVDLDRVLSEVGTPCYLYSAELVRRRFAELTGAFPGYKVCYSLKANPNPEVVRMLRELGAGAEVSSAGELRTALDAGVEPEDVVLVGPAKTDEETADAVRAGIHAVVVDSAEELERVGGAARAAGRRQRVLLRVNTNEEPVTREAMVGGPSKFGFDEEKLVDEVRGASRDGVDITGIQVYSASQVLDAGFLARHFEYVADLAARVSSELGFSPDTVDFGGGFGVRYSADDPELDLGPVAEAARRVRQREELAGCRLLLESGRFIVAESGVFLTRVVRVKESRGERFIITDSGMNGFSRPVYMRVKHPIRNLTRADGEETAKYRVCGPICTPIDCLGRDVPLPETKVGDVVGIFLAGAYGYTMSITRFMSRGAPAEVLADRGRLTVIREAVSG